MAQWSRLSGDVKSDYVKPHLLKVFILLQEVSTDPRTTHNQNTVELGLWRVIRECRLFLQTYLLYLVVNLKLVNQTNID